jgi:putative oligomerization/nucleic acid binding protein
MLRRRRPLLRAAAVGGAAYYAGKKVQEGQDVEADADQATTGELEEEQGGALTQDAIDQLKELSALKEEGILTQDEFDAQKQKLLSM